MSGRVVIVGAGQAGLQVASSLRQDGFNGSITLIGDEPGLPYQRPPLSKAYMKDGDAARLALKPDSFFARADIAYRSMTRVAKARCDELPARVDRDPSPVPPERWLQPPYRRGATICEKGV